MKPQHTPGPWVANGRTVNYEQDGIICECKAYGDALLIAAAPDLLESLELLVSALKADGLFDKPGFLIPHTREAIQFAEADIKKAKGQI